MLASILAAYTYSVKPISKQEKCTNVSIARSIQSITKCTGVHIIEVEEISHRNW